MIMKRAVIFGAGQTGRGFIAPILINNGFHITFLDHNQTLVKQLKDEGTYTIKYFGNTRNPVTITDYEAYAIQDETEAVTALSHADAIFTSVFASHVAELSEVLKKAVRASDHKLTIVCCENGVNARQPLLDAGIDAVISAGVILCTTIQPNSNRLELLCQDVNELPIDGGVEGMTLHIDGMPLEMRFNDLIERKIYTYNFISAIVSYLGWYLGYLE